MIATCKCGAQSMDLHRLDRGDFSPVVYGTLLRRRAAEWHDAHVMDAGRTVGVYRLSVGHDSFTVSDD